MYANVDGMIEYLGGPEILQACVSEGSGNLIVFDLLPVKDFFPSLPLMCFVAMSSSVHRFYILNSDADIQEKKGDVLCIIYLVHRKVADEGWT